jgi:glycerophosphoryl diester phosphodiesterase
MASADFLRARPIAHRGLHDAAAGVIENSLGAARAVIRGGYAIECDVQLSRDGEALVFHDDDLLRLTGKEGRLRDFPAAALIAAPLLGSAETIPTLADFLAAIGGAVPLIIELKSDFNGDIALARRVAQLVAGYAGPVVIESFDPEPMIFLRNNRTAFGLDAVPLGLVAMARYEAVDWPTLAPQRRRELEALTDFARAKPEFLSWNVADLPHATPLLCRDGLGLPVTVWTVRSAEQALEARRWADQIVFEGFAP